MRNLIVILFLFSGAFINVVAGDDLNNKERSEAVIIFSLDEVLNLYHQIELEDDIALETFNRAISGYKAISCQNPAILTIIDYTKPSTEERLFIIDLKEKKLLYKTLVAHGKNSGMNLAVDFSNIRSSLQSSPGFYTTAETYHGKHGYSLRLDGMETGINDNARNRAIVMHGANYVSKSFIKSHNRLGRSWGCPAVPNEISKEIIDLIKGGSCLYIHVNDEEYLNHSIISQNNPESNQD